ncbi:pathogenesis-related protein 1-like [Tasmannia lanceolata]|uniref:pathogenesis-related protein 1-like n=1 Tax=Tasmannia lanceolata TaxID=3420 RepID=UPI004063420F
MVVGSYTDEVTYTFPAARLWKASCDMHNLLPKAVPEFITSIEVLEGNGGVGTVKKFNFSEAVKDFSYMKDRIDVLNDESYEFKYTVTEGGIVGLIVKWYSFYMKLEPTGDGSCVGKVKVEYETLDGELTHDQIAKMKEGNEGMVKAVQAYLQANPDVYV